MTTNGSDKKINLQETRRVILTFCLVLLFPIIAWVLDIAAHNLPLTPSGILQAHGLSPSLWLFDLAPFVASLITWIIMRWSGKIIRSLNSEIKQRDKDISKNATFAKNIGEGNYNTDFKVEDDNDLLGQSLLLMRDNLLNSQKKDAEQAWIAQGKEEVSDILRLHNNLDALSYEVLVKLIKYINIIQGALYLYDEPTKRLHNLSTYAYDRRKYLNQEFALGEGLIGQCAYEREFIYRTEIPENYATITSGILGNQKPQSILLMPLITDERLEGVLEFASIEKSIPELTIRFLNEVGEIIARTIFNLRVNQQTEKLLREAQQMTQELRENEEELRQNAEEMRATHEELEHSNFELETKMKEVENAQKRLHSLLENASEIISIYNSSKELVFISPSVTKILGYTPQEMMNGKDMDRLTRRGESDFNDLFDKLIKNPRISETIQYTFMKKDGEKIFIELTGRNLIDDAAIGGIIINSRDITESKRAEKEERMRSKMQSLSENSIEMIMRLNTKGQFFYANPMVDKYLNVNSKELINQNLTAIEHIPSLTEFIKEAIKEIRSNREKVNSEISFTSDEMGDVIMHVTAIPEFNENELETILFVGHDVTEAKRIEMEIHEKNQKITESINYAQRIQTSILPNNTLIRQHLPKSFIFYYPRDVVSGDFPWFFVKEDYIYIAAVDCTGHGVPGALLSFIGYFTLNNVVDHDSSYTAAQVLDNLHYGVRKTLKQDHPNADARDGMDIGLCKINLKNKQLQYSGAHRPLLLLRNGEILEYKGNRKAIGGIPHPKKAEEPFINHEIAIEPGDKIFFFSDGLVDQTGGDDKRKFSIQRVRDLLLANTKASMPELNDMFYKEFFEFKGELKQVDDVLLIGIEF